MDRNKRIDWNAECRDCKFDQLLLAFSLNEMDQRKGWFYCPNCGKKSLMPHLYADPKVPF